MMPSVPPAARQPVAKLPEYPKRFSSGRATCPMVAAVARDEPQIAPNPAQAPIEAILPTDGSGWDMLTLPTVSSRDTYLQDDQSHQMHRIYMDGRGVYRVTQPPQTGNTWPTKQSAAALHR